MTPTIQQHSDPEPASPPARAAGPRQASSSGPPSGDVSAPLDTIRAEIDEQDRALVRLIARRCRLARDAGHCKAAAHMPLLDPAREAEVVRRSASRARELGLAEEGVRGIFWHLIGLSRGSQSADPECVAPERTP